MWAVPAGRRFSGTWSCRNRWRRRARRIRRVRWRAIGRAGRNAGHSASRLARIRVRGRRRSDLEERCSRRRSAANQFPQDLFGAVALAEIVLVGDGAGLAAQFEAEKLVLEAVEALLDLLLDGGDRRRGLRRRRYWGRRRERRRMWHRCDRSRWSKERCCLSRLLLA